MNGAKGETLSSPPVPDDPLQPPVCIGCGYELTGLPPDCVCPECGMQRDPSVISLRGWGSIRMDNALLRHPRWDGGFRVLIVMSAAMLLIFLPIPIGCPLAPR
jgi:hypothetical protein